MRLYKSSKLLEEIQLLEKFKDIYTMIIPTPSSLLQFHLISPRYQTLTSLADGTFTHCLNHFLSQFLTSFQLCWRCLTIFHFSGCSIQISIWTYVGYSFWTWVNVLCGLLWENSLIGVLSLIIKANEYNYLWV